MSDFNETWIFKAHFQFSDIKFHENPSSGSRTVPRVWADRQICRIKTYKWQSKHNRFIIIYYFRATCFDSLESSSGPLTNRSKTIQFLVNSGIPVQYAGWERTAVRSQPAYCTAVYRGWRYQRLWWYNWSSWWWAVRCSKHVEERSVTYILLKSKRIVH